MDQIAGASPFEQFLVIQVDRRHVEGDIVLLLGVDHTTDHVCIAGDHRAVITVGGIAEIALFVENHREEDAIHPCLDQVDDMPTDQFGRVTQVFRHDMGSPFLEDFIARRG